MIAIKLANGETEALKLTGGDRADYVRAMQKLREWKSDADLNLAITDYIVSARRLPEHVTLKEVIEFYLKRHPIGLPPKTVREVVDELVASKASAGRSADNFQVTAEPEYDKNGASRLPENSFWKRCIPLPGHRRTN